MLEGAKRCPRCDTVKPLGEFGSHRGQPFDKAIWCKVCAREHARRYDTPQYKEILAARARKRRERPEVKARQKITDAEWNARNPEKRRALNNSPEKRERDRERRRTERGREMDKLIAERRRARLAEVDHSLTSEEWEQIKERFNNLCAYCLAPGVLQLEHLKPIRLLGAHNVDNVVPACRLCNQRKNSKDLLQFLAYTAEVYSA